MSQDKELLLKDLCARLPHGVKAILTRTNCHDSVNKVSEKDIYSFRTGRPLEEDYGQHDYYRVVVTDIKPYLFPLSSMTEEQHNEFFAYFHDVEMKEIETSGDYLKASYLGENAKRDWLNKNHFDYHYLISKGLAIDATGLNIY